MILRAATWVKYSLWFFRIAAKDQRIFCYNTEIDTSLYDLARSITYAVQNTDTLAVDLSDFLVYKLFVSTNAPIVLEFIQDAELRRFTVSPSVKPIDYFDMDITPSDRPMEFQRGVFVATGTPISSLVIKGIVNVKVVANVVVSCVGTLA